MTHSLGNVKKDDNERITRRVHPVSAFTIRLSQQKWVAAEANRRNVSKSEIVREALDEKAEREQ